MPRYLGIDMGAEAVKVSELLGASGDWQPGRRILREHHKDPAGCLRAILESLDWDTVQGATVTGRLGRQVGLARVPLRQALGTGVRLAHGDRPITVVSIGSRGFSVLELQEGGREGFRENGRCAQGTGNFLQQLTGRFGLGVEEAGRLAAPVRDPALLSGRCPVILKTDMTHLANRGESRERILAGLLDALAENVLTLLRPGISPPRILLTGGVARCARVRERFREFAGSHGMALLEADAKASLHLESLGAAWLAADQGAGTVPLDQLVRAPEAPEIGILPPLAASLGRVHRIEAPPAVSDGHGPLLLGFDMGSTGSKAVAFDPAAGRAVWEGYLLTDGAPVQAAQALMRAFLASPAAARPLRGCGVTGSGREIVGSLLSVCFGAGSVWVLNEIAAHAAGAVAWDERVDTIFEIGGQDAKFIRLEGGRVVDAAMNEACSAGTGSFIEEQGRRFTGLEDVRRLGAYRTFDRMVIERLGLQHRVRVWSPPWGDYFQGLPPGFAALVFTGVTAMGILRDGLTRIRPAERRPGETERRHRHWQARLLRLLREAAGGDLSAPRVLLETFTGRAFGIPRLLRQALRSMARADTGRPLPRVLLTGEVYVRLEPFANGSVARLLNDRGIRVTTESLAVLLRYSDHAGREKGQRRGAGALLHSWVQDRLVSLCQREAVRCLGSPREPEVREVLGSAAPYLRDALEGEAVLSVGGSLRAWRRGEIDGAVLSGPLECMPDKLAECQLGLARDREGIQTLALAMSGEPPDPDLLDNFAFELHRRVQDGWP